MKQAIALVLLAAMLTAALCGCAGTMPGTAGDGSVSATDDGYVNGGDTGSGTDGSWHMPDGRSGRPIPRPGVTR